MGHRADAPSTGRPISWWRWLERWGGCRRLPAPNADGSAMGAYPGGDSVRLLRAINAQQAHGRVGSIVFPLAAARSAGLVPGTERYEEALWALVWGGALAVGVRPGGGRGPAAVRTGAVPLGPGGHTRAGDGVGPLHPNAWKRCCANFRCRGFSEIARDPGPCSIRFGRYEWGTSFLVARCRRVWERALRSGTGAPYGYHAPPRSKPREPRGAARTRSGTRGRPGTHV